MCLSAELLEFFYENYNSITNVISNKTEKVSALKWYDKTIKSNQKLILFIKSIKIEIFSMSCKYVYQSSSNLNIVLLFLSVSVCGVAKIGWNSFKKTYNFIPNVYLKQDGKSKCSLYFFLN